MDCSVEAFDVVQESCSWSLMIRLECVLFSVLQEVRGSKLNFYEILNKVWPVIEVRTQYNSTVELSCDASLAFELLS